MAQYLYPASGGQASLTATGSAVKMAGTEARPPDTRMFKSISTRILILFVLNVVVWVSLLSIFFYFVAMQSLERQVDSTLKTTATVLASQWDGSLLLPLRPGMETAPLYRSFSERLKRLKQQTQVNEIYIAALDRSNIVASDPQIQIGQRLPRLDLLRQEMSQAAGGSVAASNLVESNGHAYKSALAPIYAEDKISAVLAIDMSPWYLIYLKSFRNSLLLFTGISLIFSVLSARFLSRTITGPISQMVRRVEAIGKAHYEEPLEVKGSDELATLASSIEAMRQNISQRDTQMKMMLSGIAHEIRNPLGGMELFAGILEKEKLGEKEKEYVKKIKSEITNLKYLLNEFLEFARPKQLEYDTISLPGLISELESLLAGELKEKQVAWMVRIDPEVDFISADRTRLKQALLNLYRNAAQAVSVSGEVRSAVRKNGSGVVLEISNSQTTPLSNEAASRIFEPFFTTREKGIGLGLPLAKGIIEAHGGEIHLTENDISQITFAVKIPTGPPS